MSDIRRLFPFIRPYLPLLAAALFLLVLSGMLEGLIIMLLAPIFNSLTPAHLAAGAGDKFEFLPRYLGIDRNSLSTIAGLLVLFAFLKGTLLYFSEYMMSFSGQHVVAALRKRLYAHLLDQSLSFYSSHPTGKLMARVITDTERLQETVSKTLTDSMRQVVLLLVFLGVVFYTDWILALLSFLVAPVVLGVTTHMGRRIRKVSRKSQENLEELSHGLQETIGGQRIVKAFGMEDYERERFESITDRLVRSNLGAARISALNSPVIEFIGYASFVPFLLYANHQIQHGLTIGAFVVFIAALFRLYEPVRKLSRMHLHFQQAFACSQRVFQLLDTEVTVGEREGAVELPRLRQDIVFEGVRFQYQEDSAGVVLEDFDLRIRRGEVVALVGPSGAGKTTVASLIPRFYDVTGGRICVDGVDIREVTLQSLRGQIAIVTQETFLFNDTVRNNIAYGRKDCLLPEIEEAARAAFIHDFVCSLPEGYQTVIGERGQRLSGGQRQRIAIARAILKKASLLILDEATSSLDAESERLVQDALSNLMRNCTTLVIAHRLSTVRMADRIVVMEGGRIVETGNHDRLLEQSGVYRRLYDLQFVETLQQSAG